MSFDLVQVLVELVSIPSVNPMGRPLRGPEFFEYRVTEYLEKLFARLGLPCERQTIEPQRDNIVARLDGDVPAEEGGPVLLFEAHQDTVPVDGMTIDPWRPVVANGRVTGRGSCDIKGGMTAMLGALARLAAERPRRMPTILMACTVNEEHGYSGAVGLTQMWKPGGSKLFPRAPDAAVIAEPTLLDVVVAHKGAVRWRCHTRGRAAHSSQPQLGVNAAFRMARVLLALEKYQQEICPTLAQHPRCGGVTLSVGTINGGISVNTVPEQCTIEIDRRLLPGESNAQAYDHVVQYVRTFPGIDFEVVHDPPFMWGATLNDTHNLPLADTLRQAAAEVHPECRLVGVPFGTDAAAISQSGVPCVVFGPGSIDQAHTADEWLAIEQLVRASEALYRFAREFGR